MTATTGRGRQRTWSLFGDVRRRPTAYEAVTGMFHYHFRREPAPFELDPDWTLNQWYLRYREGSTLQVSDWEEFRDPARLTYRDYVSQQHEREIYLDAIIDRYEHDDYVAALPRGWVDTLRVAFIPMRFAVHTLQMASLYVGQMAPSSYITNCAHFQAADEMRRIQRIAYWTRVLADAHGEDLASTEVTRELWQDDERWQPLREVVEHLLATYDWGEAYAALNLAVKPALDTVLNDLIGRLANANTDPFLAALASEFTLDARRGQEWSIALARYVRERSEPAHDAVVTWREKWIAEADAAATAVTATFAGAPVALGHGTVAGAFTAMRETQRAELAA
jgi:toluene monooxygenase system protein E